jgi:hypothetical protein
MRQEFNYKLNKQKVISRKRYVAQTASAEIQAIVAAGGNQRYPTQGKNDR